MFPIFKVGTKADRGPALYFGAESFESVPGPSKRVGTEHEIERRLCRPNRFDDGLRTARDTPVMNQTLGVVMESPSRVE